MVMSIADIDSWNPEAIRSVGAAGNARAAAAGEAGSRLRSLRAFGTWRGGGADAARTRTETIADQLQRHGRAAATVAAAANAAADEVRAIKAQLAQLRTALGRHGIIIRADGTVVPPPNLASLAPARQRLIASLLTAGQLSVDRIRLAAELTDARLADALNPAGGDEFDPPQSVHRPAGHSG